MDPVVLGFASLLKDYGPLGFCALLLYALKTVMGWWRECMQARLDDGKARVDENKVVIERIAVALEKQASTNSDIAENMKDLRDGQGEIQKVSTEAALTAAAGLKSTTEKLTELKAGQDRALTGAAR